MKVESGFADCLAVECAREESRTRETQRNRYAGPWHKLSFGQAKFEIPIKHSSGDVGWVVGYIKPGVQRRSWLEMKI